MQDTIYILITIGFFVLSRQLIRLCANLEKGEKP